MDEKRNNELNELQQQLGLKFNDLALLNNSLVHSSYVNENRGEFTSDNEKLELLGDSVLALVVNEYLYKSFPDSTEGELSNIKSIVVSEHSLAGIAREIDLGHFLLLGRGEQLSNGMNRQAILADTFEALLGAYYLDRGLAPVRDLILPFIITEVDKIRKNQHQKDYKTQLQLLSQQKYKSCPLYETVYEDGPDHQKTFYVHVVVNNDVVGSGSGSSKKLAQQHAAHSAIDKLLYKKH